MSKLLRFVSDYEEVLYVSVAFGAGLVAAGVVLIIINVL